MATTPHAPAVVWVDPESRLAPRPNPTPAASSSGGKSTSDGRMVRRWVMICSNGCITVRSFRNSKGVIFHLSFKWESGDSINVSSTSRGLRAPASTSAVLRCRMPAAVSTPSRDLGKAVRGSPGPMPGSSTSTNDTAAELDRRDPRLLNNGAAAPASAPAPAPDLESAASVADAPALGVRLPALSWTLGRGDWLGTCSGDSTSAPPTTDIVQSPSGALVSSTPAGASPCAPPAARSPSMWRHNRCRSTYVNPMSSRSSVVRNSKSIMVRTPI